LLYLHACNNHHHRYEQQCEHSYYFRFFHVFSTIVDRLFSVCSVMRIHS
jgi:hypothetical protein